MAAVSKCKNIKTVYLVGVKTEPEKPAVDGKQEKGEKEIIVQIENYPFKIVTTDLWNEKLMGTDLYRKDFEEITQPNVCYGG